MKINKYFNAEFEVLLNLAETIINYHISPKVLYLSELIPPLTLLKPDIMVNCTNDYKMYYSVYSSIWHELSHGAHLQAMINNKGKDFATKYWTTVVHQEAFNSLKDMKNTYGQKGDDNWEYIALAEGWANFRQYKMCKKYLKYNSISKVHESNADGYYNESPADNKKDIFYRYAGLMTELHNIITDVNFEHVISKSSSIREFEEHLLNLYLDNKYISNQLNKAFNKYEALN